MEALHRPELPHLDALLASRAPPGTDPQISRQKWRSHAIERLRVERDSSCRLPLPSRLPAYECWPPQPLQRRHAAPRSRGADSREPGDRPVRGDRRPGEAQAAAGDVPSRPGRADAEALPHHRRGPARGRASRSSASWRGRRSRPRAARTCRRRPGIPFAESLRFVGVGDGFDALGDAVAEAREELGGEAELLYYLSLPPSAMPARSRRWAPAVSAGARG